MVTAQQTTTKREPAQDKFGEENGWRGPPEFAANFLVIFLILQLSFEALNVSATDLKFFFETSQLSRRRFAQLGQRRLQSLNVFDQGLDLATSTTQNKMQNENETIDHCLWLHKPFHLELHNLHRRSRVYFN